MLDNFISRKTAMPVFTDEELRRLAMPVLLIVSRQDALFDWQKTVERLKTLLPDLKTVVLSEAGHSIYDHTELILPFLYKSETEAVTLDSVLTPSGY
jgi:pimeloyl-ACP methyl ester carboxylesterase